MDTFAHLKSEKADRLEKYLEVTELPSEFRYYNTKSIWVRGLYFSELESLSKFYDEEIEFEKQLSKLVTIFDDVIKGVDILEMEIPDFLIAVAIANLLTYDNYTLPVAGKCRNLVDNTEHKEQIKEQISKLEEEMANLDDEETINQIMQQIIELQTQLELEPPKKICNTPLAPVSLDDIEFYPVNKDIKGDSVQIADERVQLKPILVKDVIDKQIFEREHKDFNEKALLLALYLDNKLPLDVRYKMIVTSRVEVINKIIDYDKKVDIVLKPVTKRCPKCGYQNKLYLSMNTFKVLP